MHLHRFAQVGSTNDEARRLAEDGAGHGTVVIAGEQTAGRGRRGRAWFSPPGNLHCSILLDPGPAPERAAELTFVGCVALREALAFLVPNVTFACKWPNDVLCDGAKVAGMLLERDGRWVILGVGVNVIAAPPADIATYPAICLNDVGGSADAEATCAAFVERLDGWYRRWRSDGFAAVRGEWLAYAIGVGEVVTVRLADASVLQGRFGGLDANGALLLDSPEGGRRSILAGDVFFAA